ncbi:related to PTR2 - Di- and tripeptide permease [Cephalotrichum gorgonifer]|uniref:Related to PTR2 - Di- and tripeptide permease n=1 Tax=Cephalotrichum gorgonifer TaxID=2041049 RepID=A0AAE8MNL8_9PEZI|nr:related to PTR2 - Di- and tripeptide permease [Cephalotrichum gorgonifer]
MSVEHEFKGAEIAPEKIESPTEKPGTPQHGPTDAESTTGPNGEVYPTAEEMDTLRHVHGKVSWIIYTIGIIECVERFSYYGTTAVFVNFIAMPLPEGSTAGNAGTDGQAGALGMGQQPSYALTMFNTFWSYVMPLLGGYLADTYWGRYLTIQYAIVIAIIGHIIIIVASIPSVIANPQGSLGCFIVGLLFFGTGVGWFKANISPLIAEQYELVQPRATVETLSTGERVIVDPVLTISRIYMRYYFLINFGALIGQISMVYAEKYVGFWLSYTLPTVLFLFCPVIMFLCRNKYAKRPPTGSVLGNSIALVTYGIKRNGLRNMGKDSFWQSIRPSELGPDKPKFMTFDDAWVDEVRRGLKACAVFLWFPVFWLAYNQMNSNLINQAASMRLGGVPNDIVNNLNPFSLLILIVICDKLIYPAIAKAGLRFSPIKKMTLGFFFPALSMVVAAIIQHYIYQKSPCGYNANDRDCYEERGPPDMSVWIQTPAYVLVSLGEVMASITGLEYAFTKAPRNMRGMVTAVFWFVMAFSSALAQAFVGLATDPLLVWLYTTIAIISFAGGVTFWLTWRKLDKLEEELNALPESTYVGRGNEQEPEDKALGSSGEGTPIGRETKVAGRDTYITGTNPSSAVLTIYDLFGWKFANISTLTDHYARTADTTQPSTSPGFLIREPETFAFARAIRETQVGIVAAGLYYGAWAAFRVNDPPLVEAIPIAHPPLMTKEDIGCVGVPTQDIAPDTDHAYVLVLMGLAPMPLTALDITFLAASNKLVSSSQEAYARRPMLGIRNPNLAKVR